MKTAWTDAATQGGVTGVSPRTHASDIIAFFRPDKQAVFPEISVATGVRLDRDVTQIEGMRLERRSAILAATRKLLNTDPLKKLTMRQISAESKTSVQTIYNLVGGKDDLFVYSTVDYCKEIAYSSFNRRSDPKGFILTWMKMIADSAVLYPTFTRNVTDEYAIKSNLFRSGVRRKLVSLLSESLDRSSEGHRGLIYMDSHSLSERLLSLMEMSMYNWAMSLNAPRSNFNIHDELTKDALLILG